MGYSCRLFTSSTIAFSSPRPPHIPSISSREFLSGSTLLKKSRLSAKYVARAGPRHSEPSSASNGFYGLHAPLEPQSESGLFLSSVFQNQRHLFDEAVTEELRILADDRDDAVARFVLCSSSNETSLHRRILQLKETECREAVEDIMYMLIFSKFSDIRTPLVPKLSKCIYNRRLEILPSKDWALESIHNVEILELIKQHIFAVIGLRVNSSVTNYWATTEILKRKLGDIYAGSILYGYFLKSAAGRHYLERCLSNGEGGRELEQRTSVHLSDSELSSLPNLVVKQRNNFTVRGKGSRHVVFRSFNLSSYVIGFDLESLQRCTTVRSNEAASLMEKQSCALFCGETANEKDEVIITSFASMKRLVLEAIAFGSFLWDTEEYVNTLFRLEEN